MRLSSCCVHLAATAALTAMPTAAHAELRAVIDRVTTMATGEFNNFGRGGLASDGTNLWLTNGDSGVIQEYDLATLQLKRNIQTPLVRVWGLEYRDGVIYGSEVYVGDIVGNPSRIHRISPTDGALLGHFDAPENSVTELSFGFDGLLYAIDGFDNGSSRRTKLYGYDAATGQLLSTAVAREICDVLNCGYEFTATFTVVPLLGGSFLTDGSGLNRAIIENGELVRGETLVGLPSTATFTRGSTLLGERYIFVGNDRIGNDNFYRIYEFHIVPEPSSAALTIGFVVVGVLLIRRHLR